MNTGMAVAGGGDCENSETLRSYAPVLHDNARRKVPKQRPNRAIAAMTAELVRASAAIRFDSPNERSRARRGRPLRLLLSAACGALALGFVATARAQSVASCEQAGRAAEQAFGLPPGLLEAIGRVESGRWNVRLGRVEPWPWSIDANGQGRQFDTADDAIAAVRALRSEGSPSVDVGCFQINLAYHPDAFASLAQAFDPESNATYAARFLASLRARYGNWQDAVAAYHSATPDLGLPYRQQVFAAWTGNTADSLVSTTEFTVIAGVRIWGPSPPSSAPQRVAPSAVPSAACRNALPCIITPGR
jgi:hypothetical protein